MISCPNKETVVEPPTGEVTIQNCGTVLTGSSVNVSWTDTRNNIDPLTRYDLLIDIGDGNGFIDQGPSVQYPATSLSSTTPIPTDGRVIVKRIDYGLPGEPPETVTCTCTALTVTTANKQLYPEIEASSPDLPLNCFDLADSVEDFDEAHLAEYLYKHPDIHNWDVDTATQTVCGLDPSVPDPNNSVFLPPPSGGNDHGMIQTALNANPGADIVGTGGTYLLGSTLNMTNAGTRLFDAPSRVTGSQGTIYNVNAPSVEVHNSPIDFDNRPNAAIGWLVLDATNFVLSRSGVRDMRKVGNGVAAGVWIRGGNNFKIVCNEFINLLLDSAATATGSSSVLAVLNSGSGAMPGGYVANNTADNIHTRRRNSGTTDPEFYRQQGYSSTPNRVYIIANRVVNGGKRFVKVQNSNVFVGSNLYHWRDRQGPLGVRVQTTVVAVQLGSVDVRAVHNRVIIEGEARYDAVFTVNRNGGPAAFDNLHFDCNCVDYIDTPPENFYALGLLLLKDNLNSSAGSLNVTNSSAKDNTLKGGGGTNHLFTADSAFGNANFTGIGIDISGNVESTPVLISDFRSSGTNYVP